MSEATSRYTRPLLLGLGAVGLTALITQVLVPNQTGGRGVPMAIDFQGLIQGLIAAVLAASLVLLFRTSRIINFGALAFGIPGGLMAFELMRFTSVPFVVCVIVALVLSGVFGAIAELTFGRRFAKGSRLIFTIATIFISSQLVTVINNAVQGAPFLPKKEDRPIQLLYGDNALRGHIPLGSFNFEVGSFSVKFGFPHIFTIELVLISLIGLGLVLRYSKLGVMLRSVAENSERASMLGISTGGVTTAAWAIAGVLGGVAVLLTGLTSSPSITAQTDAGGVTLLLPLTAAVLARFRSLPVATLSCLLIAIISSALNFGFDNGDSYIAGGQLLLVTVGLLLQRRELFRLASAGEGSWRLTAEERPVPRELSALTSIRVTRYVTAAVVLVFLGFVPFLFDAGTTSKFQAILLVGVVALSVVVLTGWAGQVSLGQYAFVAVGAVVAGGAASRGDVPFLLAVPMGALTAALLAILVGLPALRVKGLFLGVATFALAVATSIILFDTKIFGWLLPRAIPRPKIFISFDGETPFYFLCLVAFVLTLLFVRNLRSSRFGRLLIASRDNDAALQSAGVSIVKIRLQAFAISGAIAGFGGALIAFQLRTVTAAAFGANESFQLFIYAVLGGVSSIAGTLIGATYLGVQNNFLGSGTIRQYIFNLLPVMVLYFFPGGVLSVLVGMRDAALRVIAQRRGMIVPALFRGVDAATLANRLTPMSAPLTSAGLAALPREARWSIDSRMHGKPGHALSDDESMDEQQLLTAAAAAIDADDEQALATSTTADLVGTTGSHS